MVIPGGDDISECPKCDTVTCVASPKKEAAIFWNQRLVPCANKPAALPDFECVYSVCGGNMHLLKLMFWEQPYN